jgi:hypothetical protein
MWQTLTEYGIPRKFLSPIQCMYDDFKCKILHEGKLIDYIEITNGVRQDCILFPTIFLLVLDNVMRQTGKQEEGNTVEDERYLGGPRLC